MISHCATEAGVVVYYSAVQLLFVLSGSFGALVLFNLHIAMSMSIMSSPYHLHPSVVPKSLTSPHKLQTQGLVLTDKLQVHS